MSTQRLENYELVVKMIFKMFLELSLLKRCLVVASVISPSEHCNVEYFIRSLYVFLNCTHHSLMCVKYIFLNVIPILLCHSDKINVGERVCADIIDHHHAKWSGVNSSVC